MASGYHWIAMVDKLAGAQMNVTQYGSTSVGGDITKHEQIYELNYVSCLNTLAFWKAKDQYIDANNNLRAK